MPPSSSPDVSPARCVGSGDECGSRHVEDSRRNSNQASPCGKRFFNSRPRGRQPGFCRGAGCKRWQFHRNSGRFLRDDDLPQQRMHRCTGSHAPWLIALPLVNRRASVKPKFTSPPIRTAAALQYSQARNASGVASNPKRAPNWSCAKCRK